MTAARELKPADWPASNDYACVRTDATGYRARVTARTAPIALAVAGLLTLSACAPGAGAAREEAAARSAPASLAPTFEPEGPAPDDTAAPDPGRDQPPTADPADTEPDPARSATAPPHTAAPDPEPSAPSRDRGDVDPSDADSEGDPGASPAPTPPPATDSTTTDPAGDTRPPALGDAPDYADLVGGRVVTTAEGFTVTFELAATPRSQEGATLNVASFHDLDGDGAVDLEVWANHGEDGWFPSWRDNREGRAAFGERSGVTVTAEGALVTLAVPAARLGGATRWRWASGLEWGRYEWLGTSAAATDTAPNDGFVTHAG